MRKVARWLTTALAIIAVVCSLWLLAGNTKIGTRLGLTIAVFSAAPLLLIGAALLVVQLINRPRWMELLKNALLAAAFILWGIVQLMQPSALSKRLGDVVIALYVLDLAWLILVEVNSARCSADREFRSAKRCGMTRSRSPASR
jgi:peptidoglycan/LPS O-acetylase OafA/YrhL